MDGRVGDVQTGGRRVMCMVYPGWVGVVYTQHSREVTIPSIVGRWPYPAWSSGTYPAWSSGTYPARLHGCYIPSTATRVLHTRDDQRVAYTRDDQRVAYTRI